MDDSGQVCQICDAPSKYKCPSCLSLFCSLKCIKAHKVKFDCTGRKKEVEFVPKSKFTTETLIEDCKFLDKIARFIESSSRAFLRPILDNTGHNKIKQRVLKKMCFERDIELITSPIILKRTKMNCTLIRKKKLYWTTEWTIYEAGPFLEHRVQEDTVLGAVLKKVAERVKKEVENDSVLLLQGEQSKYYYKCDPEGTICQNLAHTKIIDYPHFVVVSREKLDSYKIMDKVTTKDQP